jgi:chemotaxis protein methyltransferase CheR
MIATVDDLDVVRRYLKRHQGMDLDGMLDSQLQRRVAAFCKRHVECASGLVPSLLADAQLADEFVEAMTINVTSVFRNRTSWTALEEVYAQPLSQSLSVWSAGCSYGAEPYSLSIVADRLKKRARIVATDIDKKALAAGRLGRFTDYDLREVEAPIRTKYFIEVDNRFEVIDRIKSAVTFRHHNLLTDRPPPGEPFDVIACRNTVIYFQESAKQSLYGRFAGVLKPGGVIFVGAAERITNASQLGLVMVEPQFYLKE